MHKDVKIRILKKEQEEQAIRLLCRAFNQKAAVVKNDIKNSVWTRPVTLAASVNGKVVGIVRYGRHTQTFHEIAWLAVAPDFRGDGIARALVREAEKRMTKNLDTPGGIVALTDGTKEDNPSSLFYEKMGYRPIPFPRQRGLPVLGKNIIAPRN
jgi:ribosomal protein S18 acetylase RimI-like enzyme